VQDKVKLAFPVVSRGAAHQDGHRSVALATAFNPREQAQMTRIGRSFGEPCVQRYEIQPTERSNFNAIVEKRAAQWPGGGADTIAWAKNWKQLVAVINGYTEAEMAQIIGLFPAGLAQSSKETIDRVVAEERRRIDLLTPLNGRQLKDHALQSSQLIIQGAQLDNAATKEHLRKIDPDLANWAKYSTKTFDGGTGKIKDDYSVHFYFNSKTKFVCMDRDYKKKYRDQRQEFI
jgi:hypothetical protein